MARPTDSNEQLLCSFCGKGQRQVKKLIAGPGVYICDECIDLCNEIIDEELTAPPSFDIENLPKPREIYDVLEEYVVGQEQSKRDRKSTRLNSSHANISYAVFCLKKKKKHSISFN